MIQNFLFSTTYLPPYQNFHQQKQTHSKPIKNSLFLPYSNSKNSISNYCWKSVCCYWDFCAFVKTPQQTTEYSLAIWRHTDQSTQRSGNRSPGKRDRDGAAKHLGSVAEKNWAQDDNGRNNRGDERSAGLKRLEVRFFGLKIKSLGKVSVEFGLSNWNFWVKNVDLSPGEWNFWIKDG
jgi:hypothetical protein